MQQMSFLRCVSVAVCLQGSPSNYCGVTNPSNVSDYRTTYNVWLQGLLKHTTNVMQNVNYFLATNKWNIHFTYVKQTVSLQVDFDIKHTVFQW